jgi:hypothetical protein
MLCNLVTELSDEGRGRAQLSHRGRGSTGDSPSRRSLGSDNVNFGDAGVDQCTRRDNTAVRQSAGISALVRSVAG